MNVSEKLSAKTKHFQGDSISAFFEGCRNEVKKMDLISDQNYRSKWKKTIVYTEPGTASLSRLMENKKISNSELEEILGYNKDTISKIRQGKLIPSRLELARICLALELTEPLVSRMFKAFRYDYDCGYDLLDLFLHRILRSSEQTTMKERLALFDKVNEYKPKKRKTN